MRPDSKKLVILKRLTALLEGINPTTVDPSDPDGGNYPEDLRGCVVRGRKVIGKEQRVPFLSLLESPKPEDVVGVGYDKVLRMGDWYVLLQGFVKDDKENPSDPAYDLCAVVEQRLSRMIAVTPVRDDNVPVAPEDYLLGGLVMDVAIGQAVVSAPNEQVSANSFFYIPICFKIVTNISQPFQL